MTGFHTQVYLEKTTYSWGTEPEKRKRAPEGARSHTLPVGESYVW
jgi:hypothetical protein